MKFELYTQDPGKEFDYIEVGIKHSHANGKEYQAGLRINRDKMNCGNEQTERSIGQLVLMALQRSENL